MSQARDRLDKHRAALWLGTCAACHTSVLVDDDFVRRDRLIFHRECDRVERRRRRRYIWRF